MRERTSECWNHAAGGGPTPSHAHVPKLLPFVPVCGRRPAVRARWLDVQMLRLHGGRGSIAFAWTLTDGYVRRCRPATVAWSSVRRGRSDGVPDQGRQQ